MRPFIKTLLTTVALSATCALPRAAMACGGFFCNSAQPVNQAAESIIFADNGDGTTTAVIQIQYAGPSESFSWLLPISSVPKSDSDIGVASNVALQRLQQATNPNYTLTTRVEGTCLQTQNPNLGFGTGGTGTSLAPSGAPNGNGGGVTVEASGVVGAFEWTVISLDASLSEPAAVAVDWLGKNGYDVPQGAPALLGPYLQDGMYLLALRLTKGADTGSIRPIVLTYAGTEASIPVKLTAVAANDDMGVLAWILGKSRAVPKNYLSLELNEARINWFNANSNYNSVVIDAANDAGGQGFVTEFAGSTKTLAQAVWTQFEEQSWSNFKGRVYSSFSEFFNSAYSQYGSYDGFWDATRASVTLPADVTFEDFKLCPTCYAMQVTFSPGKYVEELERSVVQPMKVVQDLLDKHPTLSRLYTTLSADEMTLDPIFTFNPDLEDVSNQHTAERVIECQPNISQFEAPWRIELPNGGVVRGTAQQLGTWPTDLNALPPNSRILRTSSTGSGKVVEDNAAPIADQLAKYNAKVPGATTGTNGGTTTPGGSGPLDAGPGAPEDSSGCAVFPGRRGDLGLAVLGLGLGAMLRRRLRRGAVTRRTRS